MHPKPAMRVVKEAGKLLVNYPDNRSNKTNGVLEIKQVECTPDATIVRFKAYYTPNYWIKISEVATLNTPEGKQYKALKADGITFDKEVFMPESGEAEFALTFEPLPMNTETFDFKEGKGKADWQIVGIRLTE